MKYAILRNSRLLQKNMYLIFSSLLISDKTSRKQDRFFSLGAGVSTFMLLYIFNSSVMFDV